MNTTVQDLLKFANSFADLSGDILKKKFFKHFKIQEKKDGSFVTSIDKEIELRFREELKKTFPSHSVLGEEFGLEVKEDNFMWVIDPLDGTHNFIAGKPIFGTLISCIENNRTVLGVIDIPILKQRWYGGYKEGVKLNGKKCSLIVPKKKYEELIVSSTSILMFENKDEEVIRQIYKEIGFPIFGSDCYSYGLLLSGKVDQIIEAKMKPWDYMAQVALINEQGGFITDWNGNQLGIESEGKVIASIEKNHHKRTLRYLNQ